MPINTKEMLKTTYKYLAWGREHTLDLEYNRKRKTFTATVDKKTEIEKRKAQKGERITNLLPLNMVQNLEKTSLKLYVTYQAKNEKKALREMFLLNIDDKPFN